MDPPKQYPKSSEICCFVDVEQQNPRIPISTTGSRGQCTAALVVELGMSRDPLLPSCPKGAWVLEDPPWHHSTTLDIGDAKPIVTCNSDISDISAFKSKPSPGYSSQLNQIGFSRRLSFDLRIYKTKTN